MNQRHFVRMGVVVLPVLLLAAFGVRAGGLMASQYRANLDLDTCKAVERLADFLSDRQVLVSDGSVGWTWVAGEGKTAPNMAGLVSLALLDAYEVSKKPIHLRAAQRYADGLLVDPLPGPPYKSAVELMVRLYGYLDDPEYRIAAIDMFERIQTFSSNGAAEVARIERGRGNHPALLGYDVAMAIRAALAVDERGYAFELADSVIAESGSWYRPSDDPVFTLVSTAALVSALEVLDRARYQKTIKRFRADLAAAQGKSGSWCNNKTQPSVHAVLALMYSPIASERRAARNGIGWLKSTLLRPGSLASFNDHMPEPFVGRVFSGVHAEALTALSAACAIERMNRQD